MQKHCLHQLESHTHQALKQMMIKCLEHSNLLFVLQTTHLEQTTLHSIQLQNKCKSLMYLMKRPHQVLHLLTALLLQLIEQLKKCSITNKQNLHQTDILWWVTHSLVIQHKMLGRTTAFGITFQVLIGQLIMKTHLIWTRQLLVRASSHTTSTSVQLLNIATNQHLLLMKQQFLVQQVITTTSTTY